MPVGRGPYELRANADPVSGADNRTLHHPLDLQLPSNLWKSLGGLLVTSGGRP